MINTKQVLLAVTALVGAAVQRPLAVLQALLARDLATIQWKGVRCTYRSATKPFAERQRLSKYVDDLPARLGGELIVPRQRPIKNWRVERF